MPILCLLASIVSLEKSAVYLVLLKVLCLWLLLRVFSLPLVVSCVTVVCLAVASFESLLLGIDWWWFCFLVVPGQDLIIH